MDIGGFHPAASVMEIYKGDCYLIKSDLTHPMTLTGRNCPATRYIDAVMLYENSLYYVSTRGIVSKIEPTRENRAAIETLKSRFISERRVASEAELALITSLLTRNIQRPSFLALDGYAHKRTHYYHFFRIMILPMHAFWRSQRTIEMPSTRAS